LTALLPPGTKSASGAPIQFATASALPGADYEREIYESGQVSTREDNWHDLFNALVWCRLPRLKAALNALHYRHLDEAHDGRRGPVRDAVTLLDESGALVVSSDRALLDALARRDWESAFRGQGTTWATSARVVICGHALLEKQLAPYKAMTAHCLLLYTRKDSLRSIDTDDLQDLDSHVSNALLGNHLLSDSTALSPLPLAGIPGWWTAGAQDEAFYSDRAVFRWPAQPGRKSLISDFFLT